MKPTAMLLAFCLLFALSACVGGDTATLPNTRSAGNAYHLYAVPFDTIDDVTTRSAHMLKAKLLSTEDFDGYVTVYEFKCIEDYTDNTDKIFYMYDANSEQYILNHEYYLFLESADVALYPHTIYSSVYKELILDASLAPSEVLENEFNLAPSDAEAVMTAAVQQGKTRANTPANVVEISDSSRIEALSAEADVVAKVNISSGRGVNRYVSIYQPELLDVLKGPVTTTLPAWISLPPDLDTTQTYYLFLKELPDSPGSYMPFARKMPAVPVTENNTRMLNLD